MFHSQSMLFVMIVLLLLVMSIALKKIKQPPIIAYILTGFILGPGGFHLIGNSMNLSELGDIGIILLLFFIGMEMSVEKPIRFWLIPVLGTFTQILLSMAVMGVVGHFLSWSLSRILLLAFVISLSSTAVILKLLEDWGELGSDIGQKVVAILLVQDMAVAPMLIVISHFGNVASSSWTVVAQVLGGLLAIGIIGYLFYKKTIHLPWFKKVGIDHETQVFGALVICFGGALLFSLLHLSAAFGAFLAGLIVSATKETAWAHRSLSSLKVIFIALFFVSIGLLMDGRYLLQHWFLICVLLILMFVINTAINAFTLRSFKQSWGNAFYCGALLSQAGEFGYVLLLIGINSNIINKSTYQMGISIITLSLLLSPLWALFVKKMISRSTISGDHLALAE